ncbi:hypothetical protein R4K55_02995 [Brachyspira alvinipulli]|uniref:hypothetical protein n=1 Tax=Brachyspira alvinipulli TaxID=84379 RepID=UPI003007A2DC
MKKINILYIILFLLSIIINIFLDVYLLPNRLMKQDQVQHYYDMRKWYDSGKFPTTGARFVPSSNVSDEFTTPRVPGGAYYIFYILFYKLSSENLFVARVINFLFNLVIIYIFLFWFYKKFGLIVLSFITPLILCNGYFVLAVTDFWNPSIALIFSFLFFIFLFEYIDTENEYNKRKNIVKISAIFIFPIIAIMSQGHFFTFLSTVPTIILYLIIKYKRTLKYIVCWALGVFISFLLYVPYIISEIQNNFNNMNLALNIREGFSSIPFPQIYAVLFYPTNEMSVFYGNRFSAIVYFWKNNPFMIIGLLFLFITLLFSLFCFIRALYFTFNKNYQCKTNNEKVIINMIFVFLLFIVTTIVMNIVSRSKPAVVHYFYSVFSLSYLPIILFFIQTVNIKKINYILYSLILINMIIVALQLVVYTNNYEKPRNIDAIKTVLNTIVKDAGENDFNIIEYGNHSDMFVDFASVYFTNINLNENNNSTNIYLVFDKIISLSRNKDKVDKYMKYLEENSKLLIDNNAIFVRKINSDKITNFKMPDF